MGKMTIVEPLKGEIISDEEIITRILQGEKDLYALIVRRYNQRLYRIGISIINDEREVEDIMQVAYINAYENLAKFAFKANFSTWLTRILINESLLRLRKRQQSIIMNEGSMENIIQLQSTQEPRTPATTAINAELRDIPTGKLYWYGLFGGARRYFVPNDETFQQMKSSGSLRYFGKNLAAAVARYDRFCRLIQSNEAMQQNIYVEVRKVRSQIFDFKYNDRANTITQKNYKKQDYTEIDSFLKTDPPLLSYDKTIFNEYVELVRSRFIRISNVAYADSLLHQATVLLNELKTEYYLKD